MTSEQDTILSLIKTVVEGAHDVYSTEDICWAKIMDSAIRQGVQGLCFDAMELLPAEQRPDRAILLEWLGQTVCLERL